jgi:hypothetical protein
MASELSAKPQGTPVKNGVGYEKHDASVGGIFAVVAFMAIAGLTIHLILTGMIKTMKAEPNPANGRSRLAARSPEPAPGRANFPRLQISAPVDLEKFRAQKEAELESYGWVNKTSGIVRVPIDRAMELLLQRGLPTRQSNATPALGPSSLQLQQERPAQSAVR